MDSLRVLYCTDTYPPQVNGVSVVTALSVDGLSFRGWDCGVVAPQYPEGWRDPFTRPDGGAHVLLSTLPSVAPLAYAAAVPELAAPILVLAGVVGATRVALGVHYPGDVAATEHRGGDASDAGLLQRVSDLCLASRITAVVKTPTQKRGTQPEHDQHSDQDCNCARRRHWRVSMCDSGRMCARTSRRNAMRKIET